MKPKIGMLILVALIVSANANATVSVVTSGAIPSTCRTVGKNDHTICTGSKPEERVNLYTPAEIDAKTAALEKQTAQLRAENSTLKNQLEQREKDIKLLAAKADEAASRYQQLDKSMQELAARLAVLEARGR